MKTHKEKNIDIENEFAYRLAEIFVKQIEDKCEDSYKNKRKKIINLTKKLSYLQNKNNKYKK